MNALTAFQNSIEPLIELLVDGNEDVVLSFKPDPALVERIDQLASRCTEGELTAEEREEYEGYVRANTFLGILYGKAERMRHAVAG